MGFAGASFMAHPDRSLHFDEGWTSSADPTASEGTRLRVPYAERAGLVCPGPGVAVLPHSPGVLNAANTINGGLIALAARRSRTLVHPGHHAVVPRAALPPARPGRSRGGQANVHEGLGLVDARDEGNENRLCVDSDDADLSPT